MQPLFDFLGNFWWLVFPLAGVFGAWGKAASTASERRHQRKIELYKLRHPEGPGLPAPQSAAPVNGPDPVTADEVAKIMDSHDATNRRWLDYELDVGKLIDFPMMTDVREPLTVAFLRAKRDADGLRPVSAADMTSKGQRDDYRHAVNEFGVAFDVAEKEAKRLKDSAFSEPHRQRLTKARKLINLAENEAASPSERQTAYRRARRELEGLMVLPDVTTASLEQKAARMIDRSR